MKRIISIVIPIIVLTGCSTVPKSEMEVSQPAEHSIVKDNDSSYLLFDDWLATVPNNEKEWLDLQPEDYLTDFEMFYQEFKNNFPYIGVAKRKYGIDYERNYHNTRTLLKSCTNDFDYYHLLREHFFEYTYVGHLDIWGTRYNSYIEEWKDYASESDGMAFRYKILNNPVSKKNYARMEKVIDALSSKYDDYVLQFDVRKEEEPDISPDLGRDNPNVSLEIIEEDNIAKVTINSFDMSLFEEDKKILFEYYHKIQNYKHIIFDIRQNTGGGMEYFNELVMAPFIDEKVSVPVYIFMKNGEITKDTLSAHMGNDIDWKPMSEVPALVGLNKDDRLELDYFYQFSYEIEPSSENINFTGKMWMLVGSNNYSSAEYAAMMAKESNFATLVGENTGGDGIGIDPTFIVMPKSGFVVQYSPIYGTDANGVNSEEAGTSPHIYSTDELDAFEACMNSIHDMED